MAENEELMQSGEQPKTTTTEAPVETQCPAPEAPVSEAPVVSGESSSAESPEKKTEGDTESDGETPSDSSSENIDEIISDEEEDLVNDIEETVPEEDSKDEIDLPDIVDITVGGNKTVAGRPFVSFDGQTARCFIKKDSLKRNAKIEVSKNGKHCLRYSLSVYFDNAVLGEYYDLYGGMKAWKNEDSWGEPSPSMKGMAGVLSLTAELFVLIEKKLTDEMKAEDPKCTPLWEDRGETEVHRMTMRNFYDVLLKGFECKVKKRKVVNSMNGKETIGFKNFPFEITSAILPSIRK